jgi:hypothetical protein
LNGRKLGHVMWKSKSKLCYDRRSVCKSVLGSSPIWGSRPGFCYCKTDAGLLIWDALSEDRTGLSFKIAAGPRQRFHSRVQIAWDLWPYFTVSDSRLPQIGGLYSRIYIPSYNPAHWIPFSLPSTTRRVAVEVFKTASKRSFDSITKVKFKVTLRNAGLPSISSSWRQAPWDSRSDFFQLNPSGRSPCVTSSGEKNRVVSYEYAWAIFKCTYLTYNTLLKILPFCTKAQKLN